MNAAPAPLLMPAPDAARYLGIKYQTLAHAALGTLCLNECRRKIKGRLYYIAAQVEDHGARLILHGECDGACKQTAERVIQEAREKLSGGILQAVA